MQLENNIEIGCYVTLEDCCKESSGEDNKLKRAKIINCDAGKSIEGTPEEKKAQETSAIISKLHSLISINQEKEKPKQSNEIENMHFYVANVGRGLSSFVVVTNNDGTNEVWAFDIGTMNKELYKFNVDKCLEYISTKYFGGSDIQFTKFFISHPHDDHFNLFNKNLINENTEVWIYRAAKVASTNYRNFLLDTYRTTKKFVKPICSNSTQNITVLYPDKPLSKITGIRGVHNVKKDNNLSSLIVFEHNNKRIMCTGDIEQEGWNLYQKLLIQNKVSPICDISIYVHSHHGSINGFITDIPSVGDNAFNTVASNIDVVSTKFKKYKSSTVPCAEIRRHFWNTRNNPDGCFRLDDPKNPMFIELDLETLAVTQH